MHLLAAVLILTAPAFQEKVDIKYAPQKGDKILHTANSTLSLKLDVPGVPEPYETEQRSTEKRLIHILEVADGKPTRVLYDCQDLYDERLSPSGDEWNRTDRPLHGHKITAVLKDGKTVHEGADNLDEKDLAELTLEDRMARMFPKGPVAVGESWDVAAEDVKRLMRRDQYEKGTVRVTLVEVKQIDGQRCAVVQTKIDLTGAPEIGLSLKVEGPAVIRLDRGYITSLKLKGTATFERRQGENSIKGQGPVTIDVASKLE